MHYMDGRAAPARRRRDARWQRCRILVKRIIKDKTAMLMAKCGGSNTA